MTDPKLQEEILYAFSVEPSHNRATLAHYLEQYPELAEELIDLSLELRLTEGLPDTGPQPDTGCQDAWQQFVACEPETTPPLKAANPFSQFKGQAFAQLAASLDMPRSILVALRDRLVDASSIPARTIRRVAQALALTPDALKQYLLQQPTIIATAQFKADKKPSHQGQVTFQKLVQDSEMTDEQRKALLEDWNDGDELG